MGASYLIILVLLGRHSTVRSLMPSMADGLSFRMPVYEQFGMSALDKSSARLCALMERIHRHVQVKQLYLICIDTVLHQSIDQQD